MASGKLGMDPNAPPEKACQAMGRVTGFQTNADGRHNPFKVREPGSIVAWRIDLSRPVRGTDYED